MSAFLEIFCECSSSAANERINRGSKEGTIDVERALSYTTILLPREVSMLSCSIDVNTELHTHASIPTRIHGHNLFRVL